MGSPTKQTECGTLTSTGNELSYVPLQPMIKPMVARLVRDPFYRKDWIFEIKWDGFRVISEVEGAGKVKLYSRNHNSFNKRFPELVRELAELKQPAVLDGERSSRWMKKGNRVSNG